MADGELAMFLLQKPARHLLSMSTEVLDVLTRFGTQIRPQSDYRWHLLSLNGLVCTTQLLEYPDLVGLDSDAVVLHCGITPCSDLEYAFSVSRLLVATRGALSWSYSTGTTFETRAGNRTATAPAPPLYIRVPAPRPHWDLLKPPFF